MNSKQDKLFVKRSVNFNNRIYSDLENKSKKTINTISHTNVDSWVGNVTRTAHYRVSEKYDEEAFHNQLKPLLIMLRALGCFPVDFPTSG
jgi:plasmid replication initiation protein